MTKKRIDQHVRPSERAERAERAERRERLPSYPLRLAKTVRAEATEFAHLEGISLNQFIAQAVVEKITRLKSDG